MMNNTMELNIKELEQVNGGGFCLLYGYSHVNGFCIVAGLDADESEYYGVGIETCDGFGLGISIIPEF